jgi:uncharacterized protein (TIGR02147 family)
MKTVDIYSYLSYREYLRDYLKEKKVENPHFSHRVLLRKMGITSTGFLANIIAGRSNLTVKQVIKLASIIGLNSKETRYFKNLVYFAKAKNLSEKNDFFQQLITYRRGKIKFLKDSELTLFKQWYYVTIRELLNFYDFKDDYISLARMIEPPITPKEAKNAIGDLEKMGLIKKDRKGFYKQVDAAISTGDEVRSLHVANYQRDMFDLGRRALDKIKGQERDLSGLVMTVSDEKFKLMKEEIQSFRKRMLQIAVDDENPNRVIRCNFQIFPVTKKVKGDK